MKACLPAPSFLPERTKDKMSKDSTVTVLSLLSHLIAGSGTKEGRLEVLCQKLGVGCLPVLFPFFGED
jgi:hypothetical protein